MTADEMRELNKRVHREVMSIADESPSFIPGYCWNIEAAWQVVAKVARTNEDTFEIGSAGQGCWRAYFRIAGKGQSPFNDAEAVVNGKESAPLAICLAALQVVEA